jgi:small nuclear ribonucleoprotein (snRNP)-like protein
MSHTHQQQHQSQKSLTDVLASELRGKTVRVFTKNNASNTNNLLGFSLLGRVIEYDAEHMNIVLDCVDGACAVFSNNNEKQQQQIQTNPPHIGPWHKEVFIRGSSIRWMEVVEGNLGI